MNFSNQVNANLQPVLIYSMNHVLRTVIEKNVFCLGCLVLLCLHSGICRAQDAHQSAIAKFESLDAASLMMTNLEGNVLASKNEDQSLVPASTTKLLTAWLALDYWGEDYQFSTNFYLDRESGTLWVKGSGDPFLVSEELQLIASKIASLKPGKIQRIALDVALFKPDLVVPGASVSNNPYDAIPTAIASNFNTLNLKKAGKTLQSAEPQTPLTDFSRSFADAIVGASLRINTGRHSINSERYFAELLGQILRDQSVDVGRQIIWGSSPETEPSLVHRNSRSLGEVVQLMLKYSTNFIANQLILTLVAEHYQRPADFTLVSEYMNAKLEQQFGWKNVTMIEGAGLSIDNKISSRQLVDLLRLFMPWSHLMPEIAPGIFAKTGTLTDVSTLAGYMLAPNKPARLFAIMANQVVPRDFVEQVAMELAEY